MSTDDGSVYAYDVAGSKSGRISFGKGMHGQGGEVRIYRDSTTNVFDAVITGVKAVASEHVRIERISGAAKGIPPTWYSLKEEAEEDAPNSILPEDLQDPLTLIRESHEKTF